jgi:hypothetical protein
VSSKDYNKFSKDNISGLSGGKKYLVFIFPGLVFQWLLYMAPFGDRGFSRQATRLSRSPVFCILTSTFFWIYISYQLFQFYVRKEIS